MNNRFSASSHSRSQRTVEAQLPGLPRAGAALPSQYEDSELGIAHFLSRSPAWPLEDGRRHSQANQSRQILPKYEKGLRCSLEKCNNSVNHLFVSKVEQMEAELRKLSQAELRQIREWLDDLIEDELEFTPEFERSIEQSERDMLEGKTARVREPGGA
jgi:hypothetical protein